MYLSEDVLTLFFFQAEDGIRDWSVTGVQTCALPTDTLVPSTRATPGYRVASVRLRRFGDGFTHPSAVESNQSPRIHPSIGMMVSFALILRSELYIFASSPMVIQ